jgi:hypothetical protein
MGKNRHSKDRMFITASEHKYLYGGKKEDAATSHHSEWISTVLFKHRSVLEVSCTFPFCRGAL